MKKIVDVIGEPAMLEQLAEEACEMAQAALKLSRILRGENPTPKAEWEAEADLVGEIADCYVVLDEYLRNKAWLPAILEIMERKEKRWKERCLEKQG